MALSLRTYQQTALAVLTQFLTDTRSQPVASAYAATLASQNRTGEHYQALFGDVPCVCLRVPTGGGKTIMAAHAVALAGKAVLDSDAPIALWLTPSDSTLSTLTPGAYFSVDSVTIGRVTTNANGVLTLMFNSNATQSLVNKTLEQIAYRNTSDAPPSPASRGGRSQM